MARTGHSVTAIDPRAPEGPIFRRVRIEELPDPGPFDHVVASLSLHHVEDIGRVLDKIADLLRAGGTLVVVEFAWDRFNEATAEWALERLPASSSPEKPSWLQHRCWEWARGGQGGTRAPAGTYFAGWESAEGMHGSRRMLDELGRRFDKCLFEWVPYLYPDLDEGTSEADESAAIERREPSTLPGSSAWAPRARERALSGAERPLGPRRRTGR
jgi:SAM-dependent methyltransferase